MVGGKVDNKHHLKVKEAKLFSAVGSGSHVLFIWCLNPILSWWSSCHHGSLATDGRSHLGHPAGRGPGCAAGDWRAFSIPYFFPPFHQVLGRWDYGFKVLQVAPSILPGHLVSEVLLSYHVSQFTSFLHLGCLSTSSLTCHSLLTSLGLTPALFPSQTCSRQLPKTSCPCAWSLSRVQLFVTPWTLAHQAPLSMEFSRQEHWSGLPFPSPRDLPNPGMEPGSPALQADSLPAELPREAQRHLYTAQIRHISSQPQTLLLPSVSGPDALVCLTTPFPSGLATPPSFVPPGVPSPFQSGWRSGSKSVFYLLFLAPWTPRLVN